MRLRRFQTIIDGSHLICWNTVINRRLPYTAISLLCALTVSGQTFGSLCPAPAFEYNSDTFVRQPGAPVTAEADSLLSENGLIRLEGNTTIEYQGRKLSAENALYNPETGELSIDGALRFIGQGLDLQSNDAYIDLDNDIFRAGASNYQLDLEGRAAAGSASLMEGLPNGDFAMEDATYSTCPPQDRSWYLKAQSLELFPEQGIGSARKLRLVFKGVPLIALPVFSFPIGDMRKTGFLSPILARGERTGLELHLPWYWNIRPEMDATFTPRFMTKRGTQLRSEFRYLNAQGRWTLNHEYLLDRAQNNNARYFTQLQHTGRFSDKLTSTIVSRLVSDKDYLDDLGDGLKIASITHLEQRAELNYTDGNVRGMGRLQGFQTVDEAIVAEDRPYSRLPQIKITAKSERWPLGIRGDFETEFVYFDKDDAVTGLRLDVEPRLSWPVTRDAWFFTPSVSQRFTYYNLNNTDARIEQANSRNLYAVSIDSGLFFDRVLVSSGSIQTLEPRFYYLRVPYTDQSDIPIFDSSAFDFNISQLFRQNRFSGADRIADANQLSMALTTRLINSADGRERLRASIGQIRYFDDRRVTLSEEDTVDTRKLSDFVGEVSTTFRQDWLGRSSIQWNPDENRTVRSALTLGYRGAEDRLATFTHRIVDSESRDEKTEQIDLSTYWGIGDAWRIAARWNYSLDADRSIESLLGVEYESCCWGVRFAARRYIADNGEDHDSSVYLQLVLKGLAPLGQNYGSLLEDAIYGYRDTINE